MRSRAYESVAVNHIGWEEVVKGREGQELIVGVDVGKYRLMATARWSDGQCERPWRVENPLEIGEFVGLLRRLGQGRRLLVALEPSGTYGDALRQALQEARIAVQRINPKAAHDYAEVFDGVPSQHDGKDAAVVAELAALGKGAAWPYEPPDAWSQELAYWVDAMECQRRIWAMELGQIEGLLGRHWPEATRVLEVTSGTLLRALAQHGGPAGLAADPQAAERLARWGGRFLCREKVEELLASARSSVGVRQGEWDVRRLREHAQRARDARQQLERSRRQLRRLAKDHTILQAQGHVVGVPTACVLWVYLGDPRNYPCGQAYRKAMGLNLVERSSGIYQGKLKISKRGNPRTRQWLYLATLRLVLKAGVSRWYQAKKAKDGQEARRALVAVMRKLALALYQVGAHGSGFDAQRLFRGVVRTVQKNVATRGCHSYGKG